MAALKTGIIRGVTSYESIYTEIDIQTDYGLNSLYIGNTTRVEGLYSFGGCIEKAQRNS